MQPPIRVRDFAAALGSKPFKVIAELNKTGGFVVMDSTIAEPVARRIAQNYGFQLKIVARPPRPGAVGAHASFFATAHAQFARCKS